MYANRSQKQQKRFSTVYTGVCDGSGWYDGKLSVGRCVTDPGTFLLGKFSSSPRYLSGGGGGGGGRAPIVRLRFNKSRTVWQFEFDLGAQ
jgi:hypothetical protein